MSTDPLVPEFPIWSTYTYVLDNPIRLVDKDGKKPDPPTEIKSYRKIVATPLPGNGIRITENYVYEEKVVHRYVNSQSGARGAFVDKMETLLSVTVTDINEQGQILESSQELHTETKVNTAGGFGLKTTNSECLVNMGEDIDMSGPLSGVVRDATDFYKGQNAENPNGPIRNFNYRASGNEYRDDSGSALTYSGGIVAGVGLKFKNPWVTGVGAAISILGVLPNLGKEDESSVKIYEHDYNDTKYD